MTTADALQRIADHLERTAVEIRRNQVDDSQREKRTHRSIQTMVAVLAAVALLNLYFVGELAQEIQLMIRNMDHATNQLEDMSDRMGGMRRHVGSMGENVSMLPIVVEQMGSMSTEMGFMESDLRGVRESMQDMTTNVEHLAGEVDSMRVIFREVNGKLIVMRQNVRQISDVVP